MYFSDEPSVMFFAAEGRLRVAASGGQKSSQGAWIRSFSRTLRARSRGGRKFHVGKATCSLVWFPTVKGGAVPVRLRWAATRDPDCSVAAPPRRALRAMLFCGPCTWRQVGEVRVVSAKSWFVLRVFNVFSEQVAVGANDMRCCTLARSSALGAHVCRSLFSTWGPSSRDSEKKQGTVPA